MVGCDILHKRTIWEGFEDRRESPRVDPSLGAGLTRMLDGLQGGQASVKDDNPRECGQRGDGTGSLLGAHGARSHRLKEVGTRQQG